MITDDLLSDILASDGDPAVEAEMSDDEKRGPMPLSDAISSYDPASADALGVRSTTWLQLELITAQGVRNPNPEWIAALKAELTKRT